MKRVIMILILGAIVFTVGCSTMLVKYDYNPNVDFNTYKTYKWYDKKLPGDMFANNPFFMKRIKIGVNGEMEQKGYILKKTGDADFAIAAHGKVQQKMNVVDWGNYGLYNPWWGAYGGNVEVSYYDEGTLVIDVIDTKHNELAWRGMKSDVIGSPSDFEQGQKEIDKIVAEILSKFPPPKK